MNGYAIDENEKFKLYKFYEDRFVIQYNKDNYKYALFEHSTQKQISPWYEFITTFYWIAGNSNIKKAIMTNKNNDQQTIEFDPSYHYVIKQKNQYFIKSMLSDESIKFDINDIVFDFE